MPEVHFESIRHRMPIVAARLGTNLLHPELSLFWMFLNVIEKRLLGSIEAHGAKRADPRA